MTAKFYVASDGTPGYCAACGVSVPFADEKVIKWLLDGRTVSAVTAEEMRAGLDLWIRGGKP